jgi:multiple sugar transport system substrate-binding protein
MRRFLGCMCCLLLTAVACTGGGGNPAAAPTSASVQHPVTLTFWVGWSGDDLANLKKIVARFERAHAGVTVDLVGDQSDVSKMLAAINAGTAPDLSAVGAPPDLGKFCTSGAYVDLGPRLAKDRVDVRIFPAVARAATTFRGKQCALPFLADTYGLYFNKALLAKAGIAAPPKTLTELAADAKKLTEFNPDGSIKVAGFVPTADFYENYIVNLAPLTGAPYFDSAGKASLTDPRWIELWQWQKSLVDFYGYDKLAKFGAAAGAEFSASNAFETGRIAMQLDGEWRTGLLAKEHPELGYGTAPLPVADDHPDLYGSAQVLPGLLAIPKGAKNPDVAWQLAKFLATDTDAVVQFANDLHNVPSTTASLTAPTLNLGPNFGPFLAAFSNPKSSFPTVLPQGTVYYDPITNFAERWQSGQVGDLPSGLRKLDDQINSLVAQG